MTNTPPTTEEMLALSRGELSTEETARVQKALQEFPELAAAYTVPFPEDGGDFVSGAELDKRWNAFRREIHGDADKRTDNERVVQFPRILSAIAAGLIVLLGGLLVQARLQVRELTSPRVVSEYVLSPDANFRGRSTKSSIVRPDSDAKLVIPSQGDYQSYKAALVDLRSTPGREIWSEAGLLPIKREDFDTDEIEIVIPRRALEPGQYQVVLYGHDGKTTTELEKFTFNVEP